MSTILWRGDAAAVAQINTLTVGAVSSGIAYSITINGKTISFAAGGSDTATTVAAALFALLTAAGAPAEFKEMTWTNPSPGVIVATAIYPGTPFTLAAAATSSGTFTGSTPTTASSGPADASVAANYSTGALPAGGDDLVFSNSGNSCVFGLSALAGITLSSLSIDQSFSGKIGLARNNPAGYVEYRPQYLGVGATTLTIGNGPGNGSGRIKIDSGSVATTVNVFNSGQPAETGIKSILWRGTNSANVVNISKGSFAAGYLEGDSATVATLRQGYQTNQNGDTDVLLGPGCTLATIVKTGGNLTVNSSFSTLTQGPGKAGTTSIIGGTPGTLVVTGGALVYRTAGNYTAIAVGVKGIVDFSQDPRARTGTNTTVNSGGTLLDPGQSVTFTNPIALSCPLADVTLDLGAAFNLQRS
jgi:hypothetical protein